MVKIPKTIKIGGTTWKLILVDDLKDEAGKNLWGLCRYQDFEISVNASAPLCRRIEIIWHEISHAFLDYFGEGQKITEERVANIMGKGLPMIYKDNPALVKYTMENL